MVGPEVSAATFAEAEKLMQVTLSDTERAMAAASWRRSMAAMLERRTGPRKVGIEPEIAPATRWNPVLPGAKPGPERDQFVRTKADPGPLPASDDAIAFAPVTALSRWIETRKLTAERLTRIYLDRIDRFDPKLRCVITLLRDPALARAKECLQPVALAGGTEHISTIFGKQHAHVHLVGLGFQPAEVTLHAIPKLRPLMILVRAVIGISG